MFYRRSCHPSFLAQSLLRILPLTLMAALLFNHYSTLAAPADYSSGETFSFSPEQKEITADVGESAVSVSQDHVPSKSATYVQQPVFEWWMAPRFEESWSHWDELRSAYSNHVIYPVGWYVGFDACATPLAEGRAISSYQWRFEGIEGIQYFRESATSNCRSGPQTSDLYSFPHLGTYRVTLTVEYSGGSASGSQEITVKDLLVVSIGDSNASGEGNANDGLKEWDDKRCHRSRLSGHALAAKAIEDSDPHTSVTFLSYACSGARVFKGILQAYKGIDSPVDGALYTPESQLRTLMKQLCADNPWEREDVCNREDPRHVDVLLISAGVNDIGFTNVIRSCANLEQISELSMEDLLLPGFWSVAGHVWDHDLDSSDWWKDLATLSFDVGMPYFAELFSSVIQWLSNWLGLDFFECTASLDPLIDANLSSLHANYRLLDRFLDGEAAKVITELRTKPAITDYWLPPSWRQSLIDDFGAMPEVMLQSINPQVVFITSYPPDPFSDVNGRRDGCGVLAGIEPKEAEWIYKTGQRLNNLIYHLAQANKWIYVDGIEQAFRTHGYCADNSSYFIGLLESKYRQLDIDGTVHPNRRGHAAAAQVIYNTYYSPWPDWSDRYLVRLAFTGGRIDDLRENAPQKTDLTISARDLWYRDDAAMSVKPKVSVNTDLSWKRGEFGTSMRLAADQEVVIRTYVKLSDMLFWPPKCRTPDCQQIIPGPEFGFEHSFGPKNGWRSNSDWCRAEPQVVIGRQNIVCQYSATTGDSSLQLDFRIEVFDLKAIPFVPDDGWAVCEQLCDPSHETSAPRVFTESREIVGGIVASSLPIWFPDQLDTAKSFDFYRKSDRLFDLAIQHDGSIIAVGTSDYGGDIGTQLAVLQLYHSGVPDKNFGHDGRVTLGSSGRDEGRAIVALADGRFAIVGNTEGAGGSDIGVWVLDKAGKLEPSFHSDGFLALDFGSGADYGQALLLQPDGKLIAAGFSVGHDGTRSLVLVRLETNGELDQDFGQSGRIVTPIGRDYVSARGATLLPDGSIVLVGGHAGKFIAARYRSDGTLDQSFGNNGMTETTLGRNAEARVVVSNGDILAVAGYIDGDFGLVFLNSDGSVCRCGRTAFLKPWIQTDFGGDEGVYDMVLQPDGKLVLVGGARGESPPVSRFLVARYRQSNTPFGYGIDTGFGINGKMSALLSNRDVARAIAVDQRNQLVLGGFADSTTQNDEFVIVRIESGVAPPALPLIPLPSIP